MHLVCILFAGLYVAQISSFQFSCTKLIRPHVMPISAVAEDSDENESVGELNSNFKRLAGGAFVDTSAVDSIVDEIRSL
jgi:hypothetical protein